MVGGTAKFQHRNNGEARQADLIRVIGESLNEIYMFDQETLRFLEANRAALANLGYSLTDLMELTPVDLKPEFNVETFRELLEPLRSGKRKKLIFETLHRRSDQSTYPVEVHLQVGSYGNRPVYTAIVLDITDRRKAEARQAALVDLINESLNEIYMFDQETLKFLEVNRAARTNLGYPLTDLMKLTPVDLKPEFNVETFRELLEPLRSGKRKKLIFETFHRRKDQSTYPVEVHLQTGNYDERPVYTAIILDVSERKAAERQRRALDSQMRHAQKLESLGVLAGGIAHDFNNLLTSILGYADLARLASTPDSEVYAYINEVAKGAQQAAELTRQMLAYSGKGNLAIEPIDLNTLIQEMGRLLEVSISKKCVMRYDFMSNLPAVAADVSQMRQVVMNLIVNASEAIGTRSGVIHVTTGTTYCDANSPFETYLPNSLAEGLYVFLEVADTGSGMSQEVRQRVFEPFYSTKFAGRGLGLAAIMGIVRSHHGAITVHSEPGKGATFKVLLPTSGEVAVVADGKQPASDDEWRGSGTVLIVDDEESVRALARQMMQRMGFTALVAVDGRDAVSKFRKHAEQIRLVLLDMTMPRLDGAAALREMSGIRSGVPTILISGYNEQTAIDKFSRHELAAFLQKPFYYRKLEQAVRQALRE